MKKTQVKSFAKLLDKHRGQIVVFTGAGISTESGIPDFRSPGTGLWSRIDPMEQLSAAALHSRPDSFWKYFKEIFGSTVEAEPNAGHIALATLEKTGYINAIITQNIDGLHQKAGAKNVLEIHGHLRTTHCLGCRRTYPLKEALAQLLKEPVPRCQSCNQPLRPDVVLFGDMMPAAFNKALRAAERSQLVLVVGSSLSVSPANTLAFRASHLAIVNRDPTLADGRADAVLHGTAGAALTAIVKELFPDDK